MIKRPVLRGALRGLRGRIAAPVTGVVALGLLVGCTSAGPAEAPSESRVVSPPTTSVPASVSVSPAGHGRAAGHHGLRVVFFGDSVAETLASALPRVSGVDVVNDAVVGCGVTTLSPYRYFGALHHVGSHCFGWPAAWSARVRAAAPDVVAVLVGRWEVMDQSLRGRWTHIGNRDFDSYLTEQLRLAVAAARVTGAHVALLTAPYYRRGERPDGGLWPEDTPARVDAYNSLLRQVAVATGAAVVDLGGRMAGGAHTYSNTIDGITLRYDGVHVTTAAGRWLEPWLLDQLRVVAAR